jgi:hypothetical protein
VWWFPGEAPTAATAARSAIAPLRNWRVSGMTTYRTGGPFTILADQIDSRVEGPFSGLISVHADCLGNGALSRSARTPLRWFNTSDYF